MVKPIEPRFTEPTPDSPSQKQSDSDSDEDGMPSGTSSATSVHSDSEAI